MSSSTETSVIFEADEDFDLTEDGQKQGRRQIEDAISTAFYRGGRKVFSAKLVIMTMPDAELDLPKEPEEGPSVSDPV